MHYSKKLIGSTAAALVLASGNALASGSAGVYYADFGDGGDGFGIEGSFMLGDSFRLFGDVTMVDEEGFETDIVRIGGSFVLPMSEQMSIEVGGSFQNWEMTFSDPFFGTMSADDDAIGLHGILNFAVTPEFHLRASAEYLMFDDLDDEDFVLGFRGTYFVTPEISVFGGVEIYTNDDLFDESLLKIGASFNF